MVAKLVSDQEVPTQYIRFRDVVENKNTRHIRASLQSAADTAG